MGVVLVAMTNAVLVTLPLVLLHHLHNVTTVLQRRRVPRRPVATASPYLFEALQSRGALGRGGPQFDVVVQAAGGHSWKVGVWLQTVDLRGDGQRVKGRQEGDPGDRRQSSAHRPQLLRSQTL